MNYLSLKTDFKSRGFDFKQIKRIGDIAIFQKGKNNCIYCYEVIEIQKYTEREIAGVKIEAKEGFPSTEQFWGIKGFTYKRLIDAEKKFQDFIKN